MTGVRAIVKPGPQLALAALALVLPAGMVLLLLSGPGRENGRRPSEPAAQPPARRSTERPAPEELFPSRVPLAAERRSLPTHASGHEVRPGERAERAMSELADLLLTEVFDRSSFEITVRSLARTLGESAVDPLRSALADALRSPAELVAGSELLRALQDQNELALPPLPSAALSALRSMLLLPEESPTADAAGRALAALGTSGDARSLVDALLQESGPLQERAARALAHAREPLVLLELACLSNETTDARVLELGLTAIQGKTRASLRDLDESVRSEIAEELLHLARRDLSASLRRRVVSVIVELSPERVRLEDLVSSSNPDLVALLLPRLRETPGASEAGLLEETLLDGSRPPGERTALAEVLARAPSSAGANARVAALDLLTERALLAEEAGERRRALYALGSFADPSTTAVLERAARCDPDPSARSAALRALRASGPEPRREILSAAVAGDSSDAVRALAAHELALLEGR